MNLFSSNQLELFWWVEIKTAVPRCTYYFGPFDSEKEAQLSRSGYVEDLYQEEARDIIALVKQCQPDVLTIFQDEAKLQIPRF
jgi:glucan phosphorylase